MIKLLGTLKKVTLKSKTTSDNDIAHSVDLSFDLIGGMDRVQELIEYLKQIVEIDLDTRQPSLPITDHETARDVAKE